ncbi:hypothetical protein Tco_1086387 [Tanacetum coccineum]
MRGGRSTRVGAIDLETGVDNGTKVVRDLHLLRDGPAEGEDESNDLSEDESRDDFDVVGGYRVDNGVDLQRIKASLHRGSDNESKDEHEEDKSKVKSGEE